MKLVRFMFLSFAACALSACAESPWPLVVVRQQEEIDDHPEKLKAILEAHRRHPGSCDEMWMADRDFFRTRAQMKHHLDAINACRDSTSSRSSSRPSPNRVKASSSSRPFPAGTSAPCSSDE